MTLRIHQSGLGMLTKCGVQYDFRYNQGIKTPPGIALIAGTGTHGAIQADLTSKIQTGVLLPDEAIPDLARDAVVNRWAEEGVLLDPGEERSEDQARADTIDKAIRLSSMHHAGLAPSLKPVAVESRFEIDLPGYATLVGIMDVDEGSNVRDTKTASKAPSQTDADCSEQLTVYALGKRVLEGSIPTVGIDALVDTKKPKIVTLASARTVQDLEIQLRRIERAITVIEKGAFMPARPGVDWWCSEKFCGYARTGICPFYSRRPVAVAMGEQS